LLARTTQEMVEIEWMEFKSQARGWERSHPFLPLLTGNPARQGCLRSQAQSPRKLLVVNILLHVVNILLHEKGIENGELALVVLHH
jgi:hypothetical protein